VTKDNILDALRAHSKEIQDRFTVRRIGIFGIGHGMWFDC